MVDWLSSFFSTFLSWWGLLLLAFIDSSVFFFTPFANDIVVVLLTARNQDLFWLYPLLATAGSIGGIALTYWLGRKVGEPGLERFISDRRLSEVKRRLESKGAVAVGVFAIIPPPFPLTPLVLGAGALEVNRTSFLATAGAMRLARFTAESLLARRYGSYIASWLESPVFQWFISALIVIALAGTAYTIYRVATHSPSVRPQAA